MTASKRLDERVRDYERRRVSTMRAIEHLSAVTGAVQPGSLMDFVPRAYPKWRRYKAPLHLEPMTDLLERSIAERVLALVSIPIRHGKTTVLVAAIVWTLLRKPTARILYVSYAHGFAKKQVTAALAMARRMGIEIGDVRRADEWTTRAGGCVKAAGVDGQITGEGFDLIIIDDPHKSRVEAESAVQRNKAINAVNDDIMTRNVPDGRGGSITSVFIVHARWHVSDVIGTMAKSPAGFHVVNLPAISYVNGVARALAPDLWSLQHLRAEEARLGDYGFASLYQGSPRPRGGNLFKTDPLVMSESGLIPTGQYVDAIGVDFARTARTRSDNHAAVVLRKHHTGMFDVLNAVEMQGPITDQVTDAGVEPGFVHHLARLCREHPKAAVVWYAGRAEEWIVELVQRPLSELVGRHVRIVVLPVVTSDKWARANNTAASWIASKVRVLQVENRRDPRAEGIDALVAEVGEFTGAKGAKDNLVDALVAAHDHLEPVKVGAPAIQGRGTGEGSEADRMGGLL